MPKKYDIIIVGAGHNGLTAAAYLAKAGKSVLVIEQRSEVGGVCTVDSSSGGKPSSALLLGGVVRPDIIRDLNLRRFGISQLAAASEKPGRLELTSLLPGKPHLTLSADVVKTVASIAAFSAVDAARWLDFAKFMDRAADFLDAAYKTPMPRLPKFPLSDGFPLAKLAFKLRGLGERDMYKVIRMLPMTAREFLDEWFETDALKALIASLGIHNANLGVMSAGSAYNLLHQYFIRGGWAQPAGVMAHVPAALATAAKNYGVEIRVSAEVTRILIKNGVATGVRLASGEEIDAASVISSLDPRRTFLSLVTPEHLDPEFVWKTRNIKMRGVTAKVYIHVDGDPGLPPGTLVVAPSLNYLEQAYDAAKYGQISENPYIEVTTSGQVISIHTQFAPYFLKGKVWDASMRAMLEGLALNILTVHFPQLKSSVKTITSITPLDLENNYALTEGDLNHGQLLLEQFFFMRPLAGWSQHRTPIEALYLCGSGVHGGGGVSAIGGRNAAAQVLKEPGAAQQL
jgi:phytoene dehydrogenase-like protein